MKIVKVLALSALLTTVSMAQKEALLIGVDDYKGTENDFGEGIKKDIDRMTALFKKWGFHTKVLYNKDSMRIEEFLASYAKLKPSDNFIFYYSGHGSTTNDVSGDEVDGKDESIVLSDGRYNKYFLDDSMNGYLNEISAKKLVLFDSCHSGTAFKKFGNDHMPKSMDSDKLDGVIQTKVFRPQKSVLNAGDYIVLSASKDTELSLATSNGSMFTNAFYSQYSNEQNLNVKFDEITRRMQQYIVKSCSIFSTPHHPQLSASNARLKYSTMNDFINSSETLPVQREAVKPQRLVQKNIILMGAKSFKSGDLLDFKIDTLGSSGYLTVFSIENDMPFIMYQSKKQMKGVFNFKDFSISPPIECYKSCGQKCASEQSVVYVAFSAKPIKIRLNRANKTIETPPLRSTKAFKHQEEKMFKTVIKKFETTIY